MSPTKFTSVRGAPNDDVCLPLSLLSPCAIDLVEQMDCIIAQNGNTVNSTVCIAAFELVTESDDAAQVFGEIRCQSRLSGMPGLLC